MLEIKIQELHNCQKYQSNIATVFILSKKLENPLKSYKQLTSNKTCLFAINSMVLPHTGNDKSRLYGLKWSRLFFRQERGATISYHEDTTLRELHNIR